MAWVWKNITTNQITRNSFENNNWPAPNPQPIRNFDRIPGKYMSWGHAEILIRVNIWFFLPELYSYGVILDFFTATGKFIEWHMGGAINKMFKLFFDSTNLETIPVKITYSGFSDDTFVMLKTMYWKQFRIQNIILISVIRTLLHRDK